MTAAHADRIMVVASAKGGQGCAAIAAALTALAARLPRSPAHAVAQLPV